MNEKSELRESARDGNIYCPGSSSRTDLIERSKKDEDLHPEIIPSNLVEGYRPADDEDNEVPGTPTEMQPHVPSLDGADLPQGPHAESLQISDRDSFDELAEEIISKIHCLEVLQFQDLEEFLSSAKEQSSEDDDNWEMPKNRKRKIIEHVKSTPSSQSSKKNKTETCEVSDEVNIMDTSNKILLDNSGSSTNSKSPAQTSGSLKPLSAGGRSIEKTVVNVGVVALSDETNNDVEPIDVMYNQKLYRNLATKPKSHTKDLSQEDGSMGQPHSSRRQSSVNPELSFWQGHANSNHTSGLENLNDVTSPQYEENIYASNIPIQTSTSENSIPEIRMGNSQRNNVFAPQEPTLVQGWDIIEFPYPHIQELIFPQYYTPEFSFPTYFFPIPIIPMFPYPIFSYPIFPDGTIHYI